MKPNKTYIFQCAEDLELYLVWQPGRGQTLTFRGTEEEFKRVMDRLRADDPTVEIFKAVAA